MFVRIRDRFDRFKRSEDGAVAVEFALLAPLLFAMLFGIVCLGYFMALSHSIQGLATSTARASLAGITTEERQAFAESHLAQASARYPLLDTSAIISTIAVSEGAASSITVTVNYALAGSMLDLATGFLNLDLTSLETGAYLAY